MALDGYNLATLFCKTHLIIEGWSVVVYNPTPSNLRRAINIEQFNSKLIELCLLQIKGIKCSNYLLITFQIIKIKFLLCLAYDIYLKLGFYTEYN